MAVVEHQIGAVGDTVDRPFAAVLVEDGQFARAAGDHATAALILDHAQIAELGLAVRRRVAVRLLVELRRAADMDGPPRQLGARLADRLRRADAARLTQLSRPAARPIATVAFGRDPHPRLAPQRRTPPYPP